MSTAEDQGVATARARVRLAEAAFNRAKVDLDAERSTLEWAIRQAERASPPATLSA